MIILAHLSRVFVHADLPLIKTGTETFPRLFLGWGTPFLLLGD